jgi:hypothetical protein
MTFVTMRVKEVSWIRVQGRYNYTLAEQQENVDPTRVLYYKIELVEYIPAKVMIDNKNQAEYSHNPYQ